ncbi:hypothetical protein MCHI_000920 [Candidatus Magnetoovum chiemensis]|nr:hypothetical protein MCHI_000920 [Candidatus Magnetoovum chiemensis]
MSIAVEDPIYGEIASGTWNITFYADGGTSGGEIIIYDDKRKYSITIDPVVGSVINKKKD